MPLTLTRTVEPKRSLLQIENLAVELRLREGIVRALQGVHLAIEPHRILGLVGESGCGKTMVARSILRILPPRGEVVAGSIHLARQSDEAESWIDIVSLPQNSRLLRRIRGGEIAMIFQEPMSSLSSVHTIGAQIGEAIRLHQRLSWRECREISIEMLGRVGITHPERAVDTYPHQLSGGLRQRAMIAMALSCKPRLLIADEPTTALDVTIQSQILDLLKALQQELGMAVLFITHDLGVVAEIADDVSVMYAGRVVEQADVYTVFHRPKHPYTIGLLDAAPRLGKGRTKRLASIPGSVPHAFDELSGCPFHARCPEAIKGVCDRGDAPVMVEVDPCHRVACHLHQAKSNSPICNK